jgi:hypothetical protein
MGLGDLFRRRRTDEDGDPQPRQPKGQKPPKLSNKSVIDAKAMVAIQAMVSTADGMVRGPVRKAGDTRGKSYLQGMVTPPQRAKIKVVGLRRDEQDTSITVVIHTTDGDKINELTVDGVLHAGNVKATAQRIAATLLHIPGAVPMCERELTALVQAPIGTTKAFSVGGGNRLQIETGRDD